MEKETIILILACLNFLGTVVLIMFVWMLVNYLSQDEKDRGAPFH